MPMTRLKERPIHFVAGHPASSGWAVRTGRRQSIPSSSIDSCAGVSTATPCSARGQMKRPRSSRLANRHSPSPSHHNSFNRSPRRPRKQNTWPENGSFPSTICACAARLSKPLRMSVTPAANHTRVPAGKPIIAAARSPGEEPPARHHRSEEHTSELQSHHDLVCRLLLEKKKKEMLQTDLSHNKASLDVKRA